MLHNGFCVRQCRKGGIQLIHCGPSIEYYDPRQQALKESHKAGDTSQSPDSPLSVDGDHGRKFKNKRRPLSSLLRASKIVSSDAIVEVLFPANSFAICAS